MAYGGFVTFRLMSTDAPLRSRHREVLHTLVREYIETGEPVASRTISKCRQNDLSSASIRNVMADLADEGYLSQPHTSAGRIPTEKAFRFYVRSLAAARVALAEAERLRHEFAGLHTIAERVERSSHVLTQLTRHVGIAAAIPDLKRELDQIELVPLADRRVLIILATRDHMVHNRVVALEEPIAQADLISIRNYVNQNFSGWQLGEARRELVRRMLEERALYDAVLRHLQVLYQKGLLEVDSAPAVHMEGASNLLGLDLHLTREKLRELLRALEEKQRLIELLDRFLGLPAGELEVHVGLEQLHPAMKDLALVGMSVRMPSGLPAKVAVLIQTSRALEAAQF
jgi:heat-inducible transcriptional repressor